jgi:hypothetical protein
VTRRALLPAAALLAACRKGVPRDNLLPGSVGEWKRTALAPVAPPGAGVIPQASIRRVQGAAYEAAGKVEVTLYELSSSAAALDAVQRWRPAADTVFFYRDDLFVVVKYRDADRRALNAFVAALDKHLTPPQR